MVLLALWWLASMDRDGQLKAKDAASVFVVEPAEKEGMVEVVPE